MMAIFIVFLLLSIFLPLAFSAFALFSKKKSNDAFSFRSYFSYELFSSEKKDFSYYILRIIGGLAYLCPVLSGIYGLILVSSRGDSTSSFFVGSFTFFAFLFALFEYLLTYFDLSYEKRHLSFFFLSGSSLIIFSGMAAFYFLAIYRNIYLPSSLFIVIALFLIVLLSVAVLLNPKLKDWGKMEKVTKNDGSVGYVRPKRFILPYSEWALLLMAFLSNILIIVGLYLVSIN